MLKNQEIRFVNKTGKVGWRSPSNIAIVKYWGKYGQQLPQNPSFSFTLNNAYTETFIDWDYKKRKGLDFDFLFEGDKQASFKVKIETYLKLILEDFPFLENVSMKINSKNSFPHSSGIASSASAMSALALCICTMEKNIAGDHVNKSEETFLQRASFFARLGSGSACRSVFPSGAIWGSSKDIEKSSNNFAIPWESEIHPTFLNFHDDILIISKKEKSVSSRAGHALMESNIYAEIRFEEARERLITLVSILEKGDVEAFGILAEAEAMSLHALMMMSNPSYILMKGNTLTAIEKIKQFRSTSGLPVFYTLDAGPNIHLLYPDEIKADVSKFIENELRPLCEDDKIINDHVGQGPISLC